MGNGNWEAMEGYQRVGMSMTRVKAQGKEKVKLRSTATVSKGRNGLSYAAHDEVILIRSNNSPSSMALTIDMYTLPTPLSPSS